MMTVTTLSVEQAAIVSAYTGFLIGSVSSMNEYIELIMQRPVFTHELSDPEITDKIRALSKADFVGLSPEESDNT